MTNAALFVRLEAKPGKELEVEQLLRNGLQLVEDEPGTIGWYAIRMGYSTFGIFDTFANDGDRQAHLTGELAKTLMARASQLLVNPPTIEKADVLAVKQQQFEPAY
jgi:quinol monooxygenase YgiN